MGQVIELLDRLETILSDTLPEDKAKEVKRIIAEISQEVTKETLEKELPQLEERLSKQLVTKEDLYKFKEELKSDIYDLKGELNRFKLDTEQRFSKIEKEIITIKLLLWIVIILSGLSSFPQLLNLLKFLK
jgi:hypothetical protein